MKRYPIISKGVVKRHPIISKGIVKRDHTDNTDTEDTTMHRNPTHPYTGTPQPNRTTMGS